MEAAGHGHCGLPLEALKEGAGKLLLVNEPVIAAALERAQADLLLARETLDGQEMAFLPALKRAEEKIAERIGKLARRPAVLSARRF